ncbi:hypothetical protein GCM10007190_21650 [Macrococcus hajekii]|nr:hypothetical protein GCM10007190_21650 [Macrococcus hajekii]
MLINHPPAIHPSRDSVWSKLLMIDNPLVIISLSKIFFSNKDLIGLKNPVVYDNNAINTYNNINDSK